MNSLSSNPDVIVIGAGAAGLSAASALKALSYTVVVLEAGSHVGGRCVTDSSIFSTPFDLGGSWLHSANINPLARIAEDTNITLHKKPWDGTWFHSNGIQLDQHQLKEATQYHEDMWEALALAGNNDQDCSIEDALPQSPWKDSVKHLITGHIGGDPNVASTQDLYMFDEGEGDWLVEGGLGAFVKKLHNDVEVALNCPVSKIDYSAKEIVVETPLGNLKSGKVIITVSTGVLAAGNIQFEPVLPNRKKDAIAQLPMGLLNKVGIEFDPSWNDAHQGQSANYLVGDNEFISIDFGFYDTQFAVGFTAGRFGAELEEVGVNAATDFCIEALKAIFGNDIPKHIQKTTQTNWKSNKHALGSYSYAVPGGVEARKILGETIDDKLFFAGEATMLNAQATVHGAYLSGIEVVKKLDQN